MAASKPALSADSKSRNARRSETSSSGFSLGNICKTIVRLIFVLIVFAVYLGLLPLFAAVMIPMYIYRGVVIILQKILHPDWACIMNSRDALVGLDDTTKRCECMIVASIVFRGVPDMQKAHEHFQKKVMEAKNGEEYKKLTHYYENWMGFPFWKKEKNFKLEDHFRLFDYNINFTKDVDKNGKEAEYVTEDELLRQFGEIEMLPFAKGRSPWEILVLPNYIPREGDLHRAHVVPEMIRTEGQENCDEDDKYFTLVYRVHHAIADGYSWMKMLMCNICSDPIESVPQLPSRNHSFFIKIVNSIAIIIFTPYYHFKQFFVDIDRSIWHLPSNKLKKKAILFPLRGFQWKV